MATHIFVKSYSPAIQDFYIGTNRDGNVVICNDDDPLRAKVKQ